MNVAHNEDADSLKAQRDLYRKALGLGTSQCPFPRVMRPPATICEALVSRGNVGNMGFFWTVGQVFIYR